MPCREEQQPSAYRPNDFNRMTEENRQDNDYYQDCKPAAGMLWELH
jgi:hypothetical protein